MRKILKLELNKTLRNPIFIVGLITIVLLSIVLAFPFSPTIVSSSKDYDETKSYNDLYLDYTYSYKQVNDAKFYEANDILNYYNVLQAREEKIDTLYNTIDTAYINLGVLKNQGDINKINTQGRQLYEGLTEYCDVITDFSDITYFSYIDILSTNEQYINNSTFTQIRQLEAQIREYYDNEETNVGTKIYTLLNSSGFRDKMNDSTRIAKNFIRYGLNVYYNELFESYMQYSAYISNTPVKNFSNTSAQNYLTRLTTKVNDYYTFYNSLVEFDLNIILAKEEIINTLETSLQNFRDILDRSITSRTEHVKTLEYIVSNRLISNIKQFDDNFTVISLSSQELQDLNAYIGKATTNKDMIEVKIEEAYSAHDSLALRKEIDNHNLLADSIIDLINNSVIIKYIYESDAYEKYIDDNEIYQRKSQITFAKYCIDTNTYANDLLENYQFNYQVNDKITAYDYIVFAIKIVTILVIALQLYFVSQTVSGEAKNGTLRLALMSPNKRGNILLSKYLSTIITTFIIFVLTLVASSFTGIIIFGEEAGTVISIFNASTVLELQPMTAILINFSFQFLTAIMYITIFYFFSIIWKNLVGSIITNSLCAIGFVGLDKITWNVASIFPSNNFNLNKYFYVTTYKPENILNKIFDPVSYSSQNFYLSMAILLVTLILTNIINFAIFRRKSY